MKAFLQTKAGLISVGLFVLMMGVVMYRISMRSRTSAAKPNIAAVKPPAPSEKPSADVSPEPVRAAVVKDATPMAVATAATNASENAAFLEQFYALDRHARPDTDRQGVPVTRRTTASMPDGAAKGVETEHFQPTATTTVRSSSRLEGRAPAAAPTPTVTLHPPGPSEVPASAPSPTSHGTAPAKPAPQRFNPFGRVIKCELVFTIDSTNEETPLIAIVVEPVHNNGSLIIPAGAELHGVTRPDRLRSRIFSGNEWILIFPRDGDRPNGRQLSVRGVALERIEPDGNGMTWGLTDGSYGLDGQVIRTLEQAEIKRFVAGFLAAGVTALEDRESDRSGHSLTSSTPKNAVLQGLAANLDQVVQDITTEIQQHGVFVRVPAGHQFYFYPMQLIDPDVAGISSDIASVK